MDKHVILQIIQSGMQNNVPNPDDIPCLDGVYVKHQPLLAEGDRGLRGEDLVEIKLGPISERPRLPGWELGPDSTRPLLPRCKQRHILYCILYIPYCNK